MRKRLTLITATLVLVITALSTVAVAQGGSSIPERLERTEAALTQLLGLIPEPPPAPTAYNRTRLLIPYVTNWAGFDTGIAIVNTGLDSTGTVGNAGTCTIHYFGRLTNGNAPTRPSETTDRAVAVGETMTFDLSTGGGLGIQGNANFQGYLEIDCAFPFAHGFSFITDGPIGQARVASSSPALVLPRQRTNTAVEGLGQ